MLPIKDTIQSRSFPLVNWLLIGLNVVMFFGELTAAATGNAETLIYNFGVVPERFLSYHDARELSTLITSMFLHGGWFHLLGNMWALYIFGDNVEDRLGRIVFLLFYVLGGLAASGLQLAFSASSTLPNLGASGAIGAVLGAYLVLFPRARVKTVVIFFFITMIELPAVAVLGIWFVMQLFSGVGGLSTDVSGGVAYWAHVGGFGFGALVAWLFYRNRRQTPGLPTYGPFSS
jgi:membrane associated rhomboid family serine protease